MNARYYSQRQLSPYRGMLHVVDVGHALAYTVDGEHWRARLRNREGRLWPVGGWLDAGHRFTPADSAALMEAVNARPPLPFPQADRVELWLLDSAEARPLALLQTRNSATSAELPLDAVWWPFLVGDADFCADDVQAGDSARATPRSASHRDVLARCVNDAAGPHPSAQWFWRAADGSASGLGGLRVQHACVGRELPKESFPELLISEGWADTITAALARAYHDWHAAALLTHLDLADSTRRRLELAACRRPEKLLEVFRLIPAFIERRRLEVALVQARLMQSHAAAEA